MEKFLKWHKFSYTKRQIKCKHTIIVLCLYSAKEQYARIWFYSGLTGKCSYTITRLFAFVNPVGLLSVSASSVVVWCLHASDYHSYRTKCVTCLPTIRARPRKASQSVWTGKTTVIAVVEPPPSRVKLGTVACIYVVVVISGCEFHSILVISGRHRSVGERIAGISSETWDMEGVFVVFRIQRKGGIVGVKPFTGCIELYLWNASVKC